MNFPEVARPERNRGPRVTDPSLFEALLHTAESGLAIEVPLARFHSSPAKGRLWKQGYRVLHRRFGENVVAWVEAK